MYCDECDQDSDATAVSSALMMKSGPLSHWSPITVLYVSVRLKDSVRDDVSCVVQRCEMVEAPQILILLLKRFDLDRNTRSHFKSHCCVKVPGELQLKVRKSLFSSLVFI